MMLLDHGGMTISQLYKYVVCIVALCVNKKHKLAKK